MGGTSVQAAEHEDRIPARFLENPDHCHRACRAWRHDLAVYRRARRPMPISDAAGQPIVDVAAIAPNSAITVQWDGLPIISAS